MIDEGIRNVKKILADNFVRPDEAQKILSILRERGGYTVIDKLTVKLNIREDRYEAEFSNLGIKNIPILPEYASRYDRLLCGGIWCIVQLDYEFMEEDKKVSPIRIRKLTPIQMPHIDMEAVSYTHLLEIRCSSQPQYPGKSVIQAGKRLVSLILPIRYPNEFFSTVDSRRDDLLDFAEDYEPVKKFFAGDQLEIFDRAIRLMGIFDESKTFIVNEEIEGIAEQVKAIMKKPAPYSEIFRLPGLLDQYVNTYGAVLQEMEQPVLEAIDEAKARVAGALEGKACREQLSGKLHEKFMELREKATHCNNVAACRTSRWKPTR